MAFTPTATEPSSGERSPRSFGVRSNEDRPQPRGGDPPLPFDHAGKKHIKDYPSPDGFVFTSREGGPIRHRNFYRRYFRPAVAKAREAAIKQERVDEAIPADLRFHDLRHTCAAILIANGRHMEEVKDHLGHSSIRVTSDSYGHLFPGARRALAESLETTFAESRTKA